MIGRWTAIAIACLAMSGTAAASELAPGNGRTLHLGGFDGTVYYTIEQDGYRVVATRASGAEAPPIRFVATLGAGQSMTISVPQAVSEPSSWRSNRADRRHSSSAIHLGSRPIWPIAEVGILPNIDGMPCAQLRCS
jgi:hypothetical protein